MQRFYTEGASVLPAGKHQVRMEFAYDGGGLAKGGNITLYVDGKQDGAGRVERTIPFVFSRDETCDVGREAGTMVTPDCAVGDSNKFTGEIDMVKIDIGQDNHDHLIDPEDVMKLAMMRQ
jgi:arylsulfatase